MSSTSFLGGSTAVISRSDLDFWIWEGASKTWETEGGRFRSKVLSIDLPCIRVVKFIKQSENASTTTIQRPPS